MSLRRLPIVFIFVALCASAAPAWGQEKGWKSRVSPVHYGYVLTLSYPPDWIAGHGNYSSEIFAPDSVHKYFYGGSSLYIGWRKLPKDTSKLIVQGKPTHALWSCRRYYPKHGCKVFDQTPKRLLGREAHFLEYSPTKLFDKKIKRAVVPKGPTIRDYGVLIDGRIWLQVSFRTTIHGAPGVAIYKKLLPAVQKIIATMKFRPASELGPDVVVRAIYRTASVRLSDRRDYHVDGDFSLLLPSNWSAKKPSVKRAGGGTERGHLIVAFEGPTGGASKARRAELIVALQGMPVRPLSRNEFLATAEEHVRALAPKFTKTGTKTMDLSSTSSLARLRPKHSTSTGKTYVSTFTGKSASGRDLTIRTYTAGGLTVVANFIYVADSADFKKWLPQVEALVNSITISVRSPAIRYR